MGTFKRCLTAVLLIAIAFSIMAPPYAVAVKNYGAQIRVGDLYFQNSWIIQRPIASVLHREVGTESDVETFALAAPPFVDDGPVLVQASDQRTTAESWGAFTANWNWVDRENPAGGIISGPDVGAYHPLALKAPMGAGYLFPSLVRYDPSTYDLNLGNGHNKIDAAFVPNSSLITNASANDNAFKHSNSTNNATLDDIRNTTGLERMWRNAHVINKMAMAYKGNMSAPTAITNTKHPMDIIKQSNKTKVVEDALHMAHQGQHVNRLFWDI